NYEKPYWLTTGAGASNKSPYLEVSQESMLYYQWENFANYSLVINKNTFSVLAGTSFIKSKANYIASSTNELLNRQDNFLHLDYSTIDALDYVLGHTTNKAQISYFGRFALDYNNRYNLQFNFRADSYDAAYLDLEHNWGYFPSVSVGWNVTNESFMQNINRDILSSLKVRASYGKNGSISNLGGYMWASSVRSGTDADEAAYYNYYMNGKLISGMYPSTYLANPKLRWEESVQLDLGVDFSFFKSRLTFTADYFDKSTDGLLVRSTANLTTGTNFVYQNVGKVNNHGFEFDIEWKDRIDNDFKYSVKANITPLSNNVDEYKGKGVRLQDSRGVSFFEEGYPIWYLRGYKVESINPTDGSPIFKDIAGAFDENGNPAPDGVISDADRTFIGNGIPDFTYGINLSMSYKNFDFSLYGAGTQGNKILYGMSKNVINKRYNMPQFMFDERWTLENPNAKRAAPYYVSEPSYVRSDAYVFDGSYFKIKQIQLGYNVPQSLLNKIQMSALRLYVSMDDFFTFTNYPGLDPEVRVNSSESMATDLGGYPVSKSVMVGLNLTF
ncbi:MAG: SusC/RagA family TonB-linked outer membrane protein, partial [Tannerellaceae bacterium]|nr:SusC/RagA family TonB-linked outer membrane protein [Tannerellaceae bacterium]